MCCRCDVLQLAKGTPAGHSCQPAQPPTAALFHPTLPAPAAPSSIADNEPWIYKKGPAFGMPGVHVDGMDVMKVRAGVAGRRL